MLWHMLLCMDSGGHVDNLYCGIGGPFISVMYVTVDCLKERNVVKEENTLFIVTVFCTEFW